MRAALCLLVCAVLLFACRREESSRPTLSTDAELCVERLREIHAGLVEHARRTGGPPRAGGAAFLGALIAEGTWPADAAHAAKLSCPGVPAERLGGNDIAPAARWRDLSRVTDDWTAYAARDVERAPLASLPGRNTEALVACANHGGPNHPSGVTNVLFADGSVVTYEVAVEVSHGRLPEGSEFVPVGPESPLAELRSLRGGAR
jgi:prepilin-type processing-associated H-X9-DG protein